jgi:hypothetical protein
VRFKHDGQQLITQRGKAETRTVNVSEAAQAVETAGGTRDVVIASPLSRLSRLPERRWVVLKAKRWIRPLTEADVDHPSQPRRRTALASVMTVLCAVLLVAQPADGARARSLKAGQAVFWDGPHVEQATGQSWSYQLVVTESAYRLRVGIDRPEIGDVYRMRVSDPNGEHYSASPGRGLYSAEVVVREPVAGTWRIQVTGEDVIDSAFRVRAKLESRPPLLGTKSGPVLPNLQVLPAHDASFLLPATNGSTDMEPIGIDTGGAESCHPEEHAEDGALRCLRFAFGVRNTGLGPLELFLGPGPALGDRKLLQRVHRADKTTFDRPAGLARYHKTHGHYHHDAAIGLRLFSVTDNDKGRLEPAGEMRTKGFAHREELLRDWDRFYPTWDPVGFGLRAGWADIYEWDRPGNYIDFGLNGDGRYVIRMWADPVKQILESNEKDNLAYTYLEVSGDEVEVIEVGRGSDPWDPCKIVVGPGGHPDPPPTPRPAWCPADTT